MKKYLVRIPEVHINTVEVEVPDGTSEDEIREIAGENTPETLDIEYSHSLEADEWAVIPLETCKFCGEGYHADYMKSHQDGLVCPQCWDPRLAATK